MATETPPQHPNLSEHFVGRDREELGDGWNNLWKADHSPWDRGTPSPALIDVVESKAAYLPKSKKESGRRPRALVPGCGRGYEPVQLALHGYDAFGLDISDSAVEKAEAYAATQFASPDPANFGEGEQEPVGNDRGSVRFINADFFKRDWEATTAASDGTTTFDLIYDYTFLCAIQPKMRIDWARRMKQLLSPNGILVSLEHPLLVSLDAAGPPFGLRGVHWNLLGAGGDGILKDADKAADGEDADKGAFNRIFRQKPPRTYKQVQGDMISVWTLKK